MPTDLLRRLPSLLPTACALCGASGAALCGGCRRQFFATPQPRCRQCGLALPAAPAQALCGQCLKSPPPFDATIVAADYAPPLDQLVLELKFGHRLALAPLLADLLHQALPIDAERPQLLLPVPLGPRRLAQRGFNQALEIARPLARLLAVPLEPRLALRVRETEAQTTLPPRQRQQNLRGAFTLEPAAAAARLRGRHVGIVDDVITTGATVGELAATLKRFGAARVTTLAFARTPPH